MRPRSVGPWCHKHPLRGTRYLSSYVTFTSVDRSQKDAEKSRYRLRVPLLKSPSHFGHYSSRVNRVANEDTYSAGVLELEPGQHVFNFNIFDGHGGGQCSSFLSQSLAETVEQSRELVEDECGATGKRDALLKAYAQDIGGYWRRWYKHKEQNLAKMREASPQVRALESVALPRDDLVQRLPMAHLAADFSFFGSPDNKSGSTCTSAYLETVYSEPRGGLQHVHESYFFHRKTVSKLTLAQVGDTKAILVDRHGEAHALTSAHHPSNPVEAARLRRYSASHFMTDSFGEERFVALANTRAFGDLAFKEMGVTAEPDVTQWIIGDADTVSKKLTASEISEHTIGGLGGDEAFLLLCTDGITNELTDQEIADIVMVNFNLRGHQKASPQFCAAEVVKFVEYIGGDDNATCLVVRLNGWGKWPVKDRTGHLRQERLDAYQPRDRDRG